MNQRANITIEGNVGTGVAENMMSGKVHERISTLKYLSNNFPEVQFGSLLD